MAKPIRDEQIAAFREYCREFCSNEGEEWFLDALSVTESGSLVVAGSFTTVPVYWTKNQCQMLASEDWALEPSNEAVHDIFDLFKAVNDEFECGRILTDQCDCFYMLKKRK